MITLALATVVSDRRLGRLIHVDERNRAFSVSEILPKKKPRSYTWSVSQVLDQGSEGACVGFGFAAELMARPSIVKNVSNSTAFAIYREAQHLDPWPGNNYSGTSVLAGVQAVQKLWPKAITSYRWANSIDDVVQTIGYLGPVVLGVNWYSSMYHPDAEGFIHATGPIMGGHCILARAVNVKKKYITLRNSWGPSYGRNGDAFISFDDLAKLLQEGGEACVPVARATVEI